MLLSPWVDMSDARASQGVNAQYDYLPPDLIELFALLICQGDAHRIDKDNGAAEHSPPIHPNDPRVSPINGDLSGLPPMLIHVGQCEVSSPFSITKP